jgi:hypothetical protein
LRHSSSPACLEWYHEVSTNILPFWSAVDAHADDLDPSILSMPPPTDYNPPSYPHKRIAMPAAVPVVTSSASLTPASPDLFLAAPTAPVAVAGPGSILTAFVIVSVGLSAPLGSFGDVSDVEVVVVPLPGIAPPAAGFAVSVEDE